MMEICHLILVWALGKDVGLVNTIFSYLDGLKPEKSLTERQ